jgi:hypothetical protein
MPRGLKIIPLNPTTPGFEEPAAGAGEPYVMVGRDTGKRLINLQKL